ncbi:hypothetical protein [Afipia carboxidovorans]|uniref:portal protein n=1 Tax=Afipia carboxidovorans TaxID=40137 RepID=UPI0030877008|nr:hypothetical protein CRBSH125_35250 [Afipia carboxidovorans]
MAVSLATSAKDEDDLVADSDALFKRLKNWFTLDYEKQSDWRKDAREDFGFEAGEQLNDEDKAILRDTNRPIVIMNRIGPVIDSVTGSEVSNRQEVQFIPRTQGDVQVNEVLTSAAKWFRDQCDAEDEESDAFRDTVVCGMGWTETRLDYEDEPDGKPIIERVDPLEMVWDSAAKKRNLTDMRRVFHIKRDVPIEEARALCPGDPSNPFEDEDYNATWVDGKDEKSEHHNDNRFYNKDGTTDGQSVDKSVTMVRAQWWERVPVYLVLNPLNPDEVLTLEEDEFKNLKAKAKIANGSLQFVKQTRKVFKQAFLGSVLLEVGPAPCDERFSFNCMTGKRDRNKNTWFGLVRAMKDPARWANKWMSQTMHIMNTSAKGGIAVEKGSFFDDEAQGEESWAKNDQVTWLKQGALSGQNPKFMPKPVAQFPSNSFQLMEFAISSIRDCSGVNVEILGMQNSSGQAASLDLQRKQSAMTILQPLFDSLRRYRKQQGRLLLYLIENYLSDGRLIRIVGEEGEQYVPLVRQEGTATYDVIVDESPVSPNQKEATWAMLQQLLPVIGKMLPTDTWLALLKYCPLPTSAQQDIAKSLEQASSKPDPEQQQFQAEQQRKDQEATAEIQRKNKLTDAEIENKRRSAQADTLTKMMNTPPAIGPDGLPVAAGGNEAAMAMMSMMQEMMQGFQALVASLNAPKKLLRDEQGNIIGTAPVQQGMN